MKKKAKKIMYPDQDGMGPPSLTISVRFILVICLSLFPSFCVADLQYFSFLNEAYIENTYIVCHVSKMSNEVGRIDNFRALVRKLSFLPSELNIFDILQH